LASARAFAGDGHLVGIICTEASREATLNAFHSEGVRISEARSEGLSGTITVVSPSEAKGLEFDAVVVVEPVEIATEDTHGRRQLYIAFTRTTGHLAVVYSESFLSGDNVVVGDFGSSSTDVEAESPGLGEIATPVRLEPERSPNSNAATRALARYFVEEIKNVVQEDQIDSVLEAIREELGRV
jgi:superfamily I DNA/RNA helicase